MKSNGILQRINDALPPPSSIVVCFDLNSPKSSVKRVNMLSLLVELYFRIEKNPKNLCDF